MKGLELLAFIKDHQIGSIESLALALKISDATARRRLNELASAGLINLIRGGKFELVDELVVSVDDTFKQKTVGLNKQLSAKIAASQIRDREIIFIDNGTTVREMLKYITANEVKIYTNGVFHTINNRNLDADINIIPGELLIKEASIVGAEAISYLSSLALDRAFVGANGFDKDGVYTPHRREMIIKEFALRSANHGYIVLEDNKRGLKSKYKICDVDAYQIITESTI